MLPLKNFTANSLSCICGINQSSGKHYTFVTCISSVAIANVDLFHYKLPCYEFNIPSCEKKKQNPTQQFGLNAVGMVLGKYLHAFKLSGANTKRIYLLS